MNQFASQLAILDQFAGVEGNSDWNAYSNSLPRKNNEAIISCLTAMHEKGSNYFYTKHLYWNCSNQRWQRRNGDVIPQNVEIVAWKTA